jgi:hypothetical protein
MQSIIQLHSLSRTRQPTPQRRVFPLGQLWLAVAGVILLGLSWGLGSTHVAQSDPSGSAAQTETLRRDREPSPVGIEPATGRQIDDKAKSLPVIVDDRFAQPEGPRECSTELIADAPPSREMPRWDLPAVVPAEETAPPTLTDLPLVASHTLADALQTEESAESIRQCSQEEPSPVRRDNPGKNAAKPERIGVPIAPIEFESRPLTSLTVNIGHKKGVEPADVARDYLTRLEAKTGAAVFGREWPMVCCQWDAPALAYRPLYFEEVNLERYGYSPRYLGVVQPAISAGQFFTTVPLLPYKMFAEPAREPVYTLGQYRPGSDVPYQVVVPPLSLSGAGVEAGVVTGLIFAIP